MPSPPPLPSPPEDADATSRLNRAFWDPRTPEPNESESEDEENDPSSIADVFADVRDR